MFSKEIDQNDVKEVAVFAAGICCHLFNQSVYILRYLTEMGFFDDCLDAAPLAKTMRVNGVTTFLLHVSQCITFRQTQFVTATLISKLSLKSLYFRLGFKVIKYFTTSPHFEKACKRFNYESGKSNVLKKKNWLTMLSNHPPMCCNFYVNRIDLNENKDVFKDLNEVLPSDYWFP